MNKIFICLLAFLMAEGTLVSQEKRAILGGDFGAMFYNNKSNFSSGDDQLVVKYGSNSSDYQSFILQTSPSISFYLTERLLLGAGIDFLNNTKKFDRDMIQKELTTYILVYPLVRYYFAGGFYGQGRFNYGKSRQKFISESKFLPGSSGYDTIDYSSNTSATTYGFGIAPGYSIMLGERIMADIAANYLMHFNKAKYEDPRTDETPYRFRQNIFFLSAGFKYIIAR